MSSVVNLKDAINRVWETIQITRENDGDNSYPYFFLVGAGISSPEIPSARGIITECQSKIKEMYDNEEEQREIFTEGEKYAKNTSKYYSYWFGIAYKNKIHRQQYLKRLIRSSKISTSNLLLAQILNSKKIATTVITPNFDNHLLKSINLLGNYEVFSTNSITDNMALVPNASELQIMHVHGTYQFYDCKNLYSEISEVVTELGMKSVSATFEDFLKNQVPIVIGYSGWEDDVLMTKIKERLLCADLPYNLIWCCYSKNDYENLPLWLKKSNDVIFVCSLDYENSSDDKEEKKLPAEDVLSALISRFSIDAPYIFSNPIKYYIEVISDFFPQNMDIFPVESWKKRLDYFEENLSEVDKQIIELDDASARKDIKTVTSIISSINMNYISMDDVIHIMNGVVRPFVINKNRIDEKDVLISFINAVIDILLKKNSEFSTEEFSKYIHLIVKCISEHKKIIQLDKTKELYDRLLRISNNMQDISLKLGILGIKSSIVSGDEKIDLLTKLINLGENKIENIDISLKLMLAIGDFFTNAPNLEIHYVELMEKIQETHKDNEIINERFFFNQLSLCERKNAEINLDINSVVNKIECMNVNSRLLLHARKIQCCLENDVENKISIAEKAISEYDIKDINSCMECIDYAWVLSSVINGKVEISKRVEQKYIDEAFLLCEKENNCKIVSKIITSTIFIYIRNISSMYEKQVLLEKIIGITDSNGLMEEYGHYLYELFDCMDNEEKEKYKVEHKKSGIYDLALKKVSEAIECYGIQEKEKCKDLLMEASEGFESVFDGKYNPALINICFMVRRGEIPEIRVPALDLLNRITWMDKDAFYQINEALIYAQQEKWEKANASICNIKYSLDSAIQWWGNENNVGEYEKNLVLCLLLFNDVIGKNHNILNDDFWNIGRHNVKLPSNISQRLNEIKQGN